MARDPNKSDREYIEQARERYQPDGEVEIDDEAGVSRNDDADGSHGAYVQAWVWVDDDVSECVECGAAVSNVVICADGREICPSCFTAAAG